MKLCLQVALVAAAATLAQAAPAAESSYDMVVCTHGGGTPVESNGELAAFGVENWGVVAESSNKQWDNASTHCVGYVRVLAGKRVGRGVCRWMLAGGDSAVGEFDYAASGEQTFTWLSGTGKLKGISGSGTFREPFNAPPVDAPSVQGCRRDWGSYRLP